MINGTTGGVVVTSFPWCPTWLYPTPPANVRHSQVSPPGRQSPLTTNGVQLYCISGGSPHTMPVFMPISCLSLSLISIFLSLVLLSAHPRAVHLAPAVLGGVPELRQAAKKAPEGVPHHAGISPQGTVKEQHRAATAASTTASAMATGGRR